MPFTAITGTSHPFPSSTLCSGSFKTHLPPSQTQGQLLREARRFIASDLVKSSSILISGIKL